MKHAIGFPAVTRILTVVWIAVVTLPAAAQTDQTRDRQTMLPGQGGRSISVEVVRPKRRTVVRELRMPATLRADEQVDLFAKTSGYVARIDLDIGDRVRKGDVLVEIDVPEMADELRQAEAILHAKEARVTAARAKATHAQRLLDTARTQVRESAARHELDEINLQRKQELQQGNAIPQQALDEALSAHAVTRLQTQTGTGVPADELRAQARLAGRRQDLVAAMKEFYDASVALAVTLRLESHVTLVPSIDELPPVNLVREDLDIDELLDIALTFRRDLEGARMLAEAAVADRGSTWWGGFGPQFMAGYQYGGITGHADNVRDNGGIPGNLIVNPASPSGSFASNPVANGLIKEGILRGSQRLGGHDDQTYSFSDQTRVDSGVRWRLSLSAFGDLKKAGARERLAAIEAQRRLDRVKAQVVATSQASRAHRELMGLSRQQVASATEALRLSEANLQAGTMTTLDVLQAQEAASHARLRHAEAVVHHNQSQVNLLAALGLLNEETLIGPTADMTEAADDQ